MNADLLFFCTICRGKSPEEIDQLRCAIDHKIETFKKGELIASQGDRVNSLYMLTKGRE